MCFARGFKKKRKKVEFLFCGWKVRPVVAWNLAWNILVKLDYCFLPLFFTKELKFRWFMYSILFMRWHLFDCFFKPQKMYSKIKYYLRICLGICVYFHSNNNISRYTSSGRRPEIPGIKKSSRIYIAQVSWMVRWKKFRRTLRPRARVGFLPKAFFFFTLPYASNLAINSSPRQLCPWFQWLIHEYWPCIGHFLYFWGNISKTLTQHRVWCHRMANTHASSQVQ